MQTRFVFGMLPQTKVAGEAISGHEVNEYWSNEYGKWVMMDPQRDESFVDARTLVPCGMLELHRELLETYFPGREIDYGPKDYPEELPGTLTRMWKGLDPAPEAEPYIVRAKWGCLHWMPRNNFYAHRYPEPLAQGRCAWCWEGYWSWSDAQTPPQPNYTRYTSRRADIEWTINRVRWALAAASEPGAAAGAEPGTVEVLLATVTPDFDTFLASADGGQWQPCGEKFAWRLHSGRNRLEMRTRTRAGILGLPSAVEVKYASQ
jgi:hypothetical protein